jgi:hypothetical protein
MTTPELQISHRPWHLAARMVSRGAALLPLGVGTLALGMALYHWVEGLRWPDAFLNAVMLLGGMGPVDPVRTTAGKWAGRLLCAVRRRRVLGRSRRDVGPGHPPRPAAVPPRDGRGADRYALADPAGILPCQPRVGFPGSCTR